MRIRRSTNIYGGVLATLLTAGVAAAAPALASAGAVPSVEKLVPAAIKSKGGITVAV